MTAALDIAVEATRIPTILMAFYGSGRTPYFVGAPGIGKTDLVRQGADGITQWLRSPQVNDQFPELLVVEQHLATMSEVDVRGYLIPDGNKAVFTEPPFASMVARSPRGILFLDEFGQASPEMQKAVAPLLLEGRIGDYKLPAGWMVVCAGNRTEDNAGANDLLSHIINRLCIVNVKPPHVDDWLDWAAGAAIEPELMAFAKLRPDVIFKQPDLSVNDKPYCTPRSVEALSRVASRWPGRLNGMVNDVQVGMPVISGWIGSGAAAELSGVVRMAMNLPTYEDIVANPDTITVPKKADEAYASLMMTAMRAQKSDGESVIKYISRFDANFGVVGMAALLRRDTEFSKCKGVGDWVRDNKQVVQKLSRYIRVRQ